MKLDTTTILFLLLLICGVLGLIFFSAWLKRRAEIFFAPRWRGWRLRPD